MRVWCIALLAGCGFRVTVSHDASSGSDAVIDSEPEIDAQIDAPIDAQPIDAAIDAPNCPGDYITIGTQGTRYKLHNQPLELVLHHTLCQSEGTHLVVIDTTQEATAIRQFIDGTNGLPMTGGATFVYVGSAQRPNQASPSAGWLSATGAFNASFWNNNEPNDIANVENEEEQGAAIWRDHNLLVDLPIDLEIAGLCECDNLAVTIDYLGLIALFENF